MSVSSPSIIITLTQDQLHELVRGAVRDALEEAGTLQKKDEFLSLDEVAKMLKISVKGVRRLIESNRLKGHRVGKLLRVAQSSVDFYMHCCDLFHHTKRRN